MAERLSDQFRRAIEESGTSRYRIARETGITESTLSRFVHGAGANSEALDRLAAYFELELVESAASRRGRRRSRG